MAGVDYQVWDWLPVAAKEIEDYLVRLLAEAPIHAHNVTARAKSIRSFDEKCLTKNYTNPQKDVTDTVAVRIITYSVTDQKHAKELIRDRFIAKEDRNPGEGREYRQRGYDCHHFIITGERKDADGEWLISGGKLSQYFDDIGGLEIQIRTVAAHAWAEFEHSRRYKGKLYAAISSDGQETIDQLFGAAADARQALDEIFIAIDRLLANPPSGSSQAADTDYPQDAKSEPHVESTEAGDSNSGTLLDSAALSDYLTHRFPNDKAASVKGMEFARELTEACGISSIEDLDQSLSAIQSDQVRLLMDTPTTVTQVRRLDDELLAVFGESYIKKTGSAGSFANRDQQLRWRYDRLRDKVAKYKTYRLNGRDCPESLQGQTFTATRAAREVVRIVANTLGTENTLIAGEVGASESELLPSARPAEVEVGGAESVWVATNRNRAASEDIIKVLLRRASESDVDLSVTNRGLDLAQDFAG